MPSCAGSPQTWQTLCMHTSGGSQQLGWNDQSSSSIFRARRHCGLRMPEWASHGRRHTAPLLERWLAASQRAPVPPWPTPFPPRISLVRAAAWMRWRAGCGTPRGLWRRACWTGCAASAIPPGATASWAGEGGEGAGQRGGGVQQLGAGMCCAGWHGGQAPCAAVPCFLGSATSATLRRALLPAGTSLAAAWGLRSWSRRRWRGLTRGLQACPAAARSERRLCCPATSAEGVFPLSLPVCTDLLSDARLLRHSPVVAALICGGDFGRPSSAIQHAQRRHGYLAPFLF